MVITDCDYCGEMTICFEDEAGGTCCHDCRSEAAHDERQQQHN